MAHRMVLFLSIFSVQRTKLYLCPLFRGPFRPLHSWTSQNISSEHFGVCVFQALLLSGPHPSSGHSFIYRDFPFSLANVFACLISYNESSA